MMKMKILSKSKAQGLQLFRFLLLIIFIPIASFSSPPSPSPNLSSTSSFSASKLPPPLVIAVFDSGSGSDHEKNVFEVFKKYIHCNSCQLVSFPIYDEKGVLRSSHMLKQLKKARKKGARIFHLSWNLPSSSATHFIEEALTQEVKRGTLVVSAVGDFGKNASEMKKVSETLMGHVPGAFLIGAVNETGNLTPQSAYGAGIFAVGPSPDGYQGSSFSSILFTCQLASLLEQERTPPKVKSKKSLHHRLWLRRNEIIDLYPPFDQFFPLKPI